MLEVVALKPHPNYALTTDGADPQQLTDGALQRYPIWTKMASVGWVRRTPVEIVLKLQCKDDGESRFSGNLRLHTAEGTPENGVHIPRRIDVYSQKKPGIFAHVGSSQFDKGGFAGKRDHWITVPVNNASPDITLVVHTHGKFLVLDEIEWQPAARVVGAAKPGESPDVHDVIRDSTPRLKTTLLASARTAQATVCSPHNGSNGNPIRVWVQDPWVRLDAHPARESLQGAALRIKLSGVNHEYESAALGLLNPGDEKVVQVSVTGATNIKNAIQLRNIESILAADGSLVYDPLTKMPGGRLVLRGGQASYVMIMVDFGKLGQGNHQFDVRIADEAGTTLAQVPGKIRVVDVPVWSRDLPRAVNWGYVSDLPIWKQKHAALDDLLSHGINVFVIQASAIPRVDPMGSWDKSNMQRLASQLAFYRGHGEILLFLGWPKRLGSLVSLPSDQQRQAIQGWVRRLDREIRGLGLENKDWALYPVDEPKGEKLALLKRILPWIKQVDRQIRIYANPIKGTTTIADLRWLDPYIDIWQPASNFASGNASSFFSSLSKNWWVYGGLGPPPAKRRPPREYRMLGWDAWAMGAKGIGFWSYSDTRGSSAWDDFDGSEPDWAVVYEGEDGPISSRRWEAFREGVQDFRLLENAVSGVPGICKMSRNEVKTQVTALAHTGAVSDADFARIRGAILEPSCKVH